MVFVVELGSLSAGCNGHDQRGGGGCNFCDVAVRKNEISGEAPKRSLKKRDAVLGLG
jgi:hypothetical protein